MRRRAQSSVLLVVLLVPAIAVGLLGLAFLGARVQAERLQRVADVAALRSARSLSVEPPAGVTVRVARRGDDWVVVARARATRLQLPLLGAVAFEARATAMARGVTTADGAPGAVLVG